MSRIGKKPIPLPVGVKFKVQEDGKTVLVGFDAAGYRLGYGAGYYDMTIAAYDIPPLTIGVGFEISRLSSIHPQPHDLPMDVIITERGAHEING